jgi:hypothetical protein
MGGSPQYFHLSTKNMNDLRHLITVVDLVNQKNWAAIESYFNQSQQLKHFGITINLSDII